VLTFKERAKNINREVKLCVFCWDPARGDKWCVWRMMDGGPGQVA